MKKNLELNKIPDNILNISNMEFIWYGTFYLGENKRFTIKKDFHHFMCTSKTEKVVVMTYKWKNDPKLLFPLIILFTRFD